MSESGLDGDRCQDAPRMVSPAQVRAPVEWITDWTFRKRWWLPRAALVSKNRLSLSLYSGGSYNSDEWDLVPDAWDHDHCYFCWETISEDEENGCVEGYVNDSGQWVCPPCFDEHLRDRPGPPAGHESNAEQPASGSDVLYRIYPGGSDT